MVHKLIEKYYPFPKYQGGTRPFWSLCREKIRPGAEILEIGSGPSNECSEALSDIGTVTGVDIDPDVMNNIHLAKAFVFDGKQLPFEDAMFDACSSNFVLEHVEDPLAHFMEVARVLRPGGVYCFRTPNLFHYVSMSANLLPHSMHLLLANRLRNLGDDAHDPYPTWFRANSRRKLIQLCQAAGLDSPSFKMIEPEPAYGGAHALLFYPMMAYERVVNSTNMLSSFRLTILTAVRKQPPSPD